MPDLSFKSLWQAAVADYKAQCRLFLTLSNIIVTVNLPWIIYNFLSGRRNETFNGWFQSVMDILLFLVSIWAYIAITQVVAKIREGGQATVREALTGPRSAFRRVLGVLGLSFLVLLIPIAVTAALMVIVLTAVRLGAGLNASNLLVAWIPLILLIPAAFVVTYLSLAPTITIIEGGMAKALKESRRLVRGRFWRIFALLLSLFLIMQGPELIINLLDSLNVLNASFNLKLLMMVMTWVYSIFLYPLTVIFTTHLYLGLKDDSIL